MTDKNFNNSSETLTPNQQKFDADPFGYSALAWHKSRNIEIEAGFNAGVKDYAEEDDLKNPILWLSQARALCEAAIIVIQHDPQFDDVPLDFRGVCDSQMRAAALMLLGYSLEVCLKAMLIIKKGVDEYSLEEKEYQHHNLTKLANFILELTDKDKAILKVLTHFIYWAGRYPDPGNGKSHLAKEIFDLSEKHRITANDLLKLSAEVMSYMNKVLDG